MKQAFWAVVLLVAFLAGDARAFRADEAESGSTPRLDAEILMQMNLPPQGSSWFANLFQEIRFKGSGGLTYHRAVPLQFGETQVEFRILGPRLKLQKGKAFGLRFEFRF